VNQANQDPNEIDKFNAMATSWWDPEGPMKPLHQLNPLRLQYIQQHSTIAQQQVLDVGCGAGLLSEAMAKAGAHVTALDLSEQALTVAKQHAVQSELSIEYLLTSVEALASQRPASFDVITCLEMLEHVPDPLSVIQSCVTLLKPGGYIFFSTINRHWKAFFGAIIAAEYLLRLLPIGTHEYAKLIKPSELDQWAQQSGLDFLHITGVSYNPFTGAVSFCTNVDINYMSVYRHD